MAATQAAGSRPRIPRGLARTGPVLFSYGFRPFFLGAGVMAVAAMTLWIAALTTGMPLGGGYGAAAWHAHEMLFGFAPAVLAGFLMTAIPNWTGQMPLSGRPLAALAMWAPMGILMIVTMGDMYQDRQVNFVLYVVFASVILGSFWATRSQALVHDRQFIESMIPHHSGAILMCREAKLQDPELIKLCRNISEGQRREIDQMNAIAARLR